MRAAMTAKRESDTSTVMTGTRAGLSIRESWRSVTRGLRQIRDWPDPDSPYSPLLTVSVAMVFVLAVLIAR